MYSISEWSYWWGGTVLPRPHWIIGSHVWIGSTMGGVWHCQWCGGKIFHLSCYTCILSIASTWWQGSHSHILYLVSCILYLVSCILYLVSCILYLVSCILYLVSHISYIVSHISYLISHFSFLIASFSFVIILSQQYTNYTFFQPFTNEFPRADIHELIAPDLLHQVIKGTFKDHLVMWVEEYLVAVHSQAGADTILDQIDQRCIFHTTIFCLFSWNTIELHLLHLLLAYNNSRRVEGSNSGPAMIPRHLWRYAIFFCH